MRALIAALIVLIFSGCGENGRRSAVPRPYAWPRVALYSDSMIPLAGVPARWMVNADASVVVRTSSAGSVWADVDYPAYGASLYLTFLKTSPDGADSIIAQRMERMAINLGDSPAVVEEIAAVDGRYQSRLVKATGLTPSPLQFVASGGELVVSGAVFFDPAPSSLDSVRPIIDALHGEMVEALKALSDGTAL